MKTKGIRLVVEVSEEERTIIFSSIFKNNIVFDDWLKLTLDFDSETSIKAFFKKVNKR